MPMHAIWMTKVKYLYIWSSFNSVMEFPKVFKTSLWMWMKASISLLQKQSWQFWPQLSMYNFLSLSLPSNINCQHLHFHVSLIVLWKDVVAEMTDHHYRVLTLKSDYCKLCSNSLTLFIKILLPSQTRNISSHCKMPWSL